MKATLPWGRQGSYREMSSLPLWDRSPRTVTKMEQWQAFYGQSAATVDGSSRAKELEDLKPSQVCRRRTHFFPLIDIEKNSSVKGDFALLLLLQ